MTSWDRYLRISSISPISVVGIWAYIHVAIIRHQWVSGGVTGFLGSLKISLCEERRLEDTQNLKCEDRRFQNCLVLTTVDLATKPTKLED